MRFPKVSEAEPTDERVMASDPLFKVNAEEEELVTGMEPRLIAWSVVVPSVVMEESALRSNADAVRESVPAVAAELAFV